MSDPSTITKNFLTSCNKILNLHAPEFRNIIKKPKTFELYSNLKQQFKIRDKFYKKFINTGDDAYLLLYRNMRAELKEVVRKRKDEFIRRNIENSVNSSTLWHIFDSIGLTSSTYTSSLQFFSASDINIYFSKINMSSPPCLVLPNFSHPIDVITSFTLSPVTSDQVSKTLKTVLPKCKGRSPDGFNLRHYNDSIHVLLNYITFLFNSSIKSAKFPNCWITVFIFALSKIPRPLSPFDTRPVANMSHLAKALERLIVDQVVAYLESNNLINASVWLQEKFQYPDCLIESY